MTRLLTICVAGILMVAGLSTADTLVDSFPGRTLNAANWTSLRTGSANVSVREGLRVTGRSGAAGAESTFGIDWNDNWSILISMENETKRPSRAGDKAAIGMYIGFGPLTPTVGYEDGVSIEIVRTRTSRQLVMTAYAGGVSVDTVSAPIGEEAELDVWYIASTGTLTVTELEQGLVELSLDGIDALFAGLETDPMSVALLGSASGRASLKGEFSDFDFIGDFADDGDDADLQDVDTNDADEPADDYLPAIDDGDSYGDDEDD